MIPNHSSLLFFMSAALVLLAIPGRAVLYVTSRSIGMGRSAGLVSALGIGVGTLVHVAAAAVGLSALLMSSAAAFAAVKYLGAAYLIYLGVQKLRGAESLDLSEEVPRANLTRVFGQGIIVNILNPKTALFFFAFLPQFVDSSRGSLANPFLWDALRSNGHHERQPLGAIRRNRGAPFEPEHTLDAHAALRLRRNADFTWRGYGVRGFQREEVKTSVPLLFALPPTSVSSKCTDYCGREYFWMFGGGAIEVLPRGSGTGACEDHFIGITPVHAGVA